MTKYEVLPSTLFIQQTHIKVAMTEKFADITLSTYIMHITLIFILYLICIQSALYPSIL